MRKTEIPDAGFTLVEMLVSLTLLAMMSIYALQSFRTLGQMDNFNKRLQQQNEVGAVLNHLTAEISDARVTFANAGTNQQKLLFTSTGASLSYVTMSNGDREFGGLYLVTLSLSDLGLLQSMRQLLRDDGSGYSETVTLLSGVKNLAFAFTDQTSGENGLHQWLNKDHLPSTVEVNIGFAPADLRNWPGLTLRTKLGS